jgi:hypothetical protein
VDRIIQGADNKIRISRLTVVELPSVFAIKVRTEFINRDDARIFLRQFREDIVSDKFEVFANRFSTVRQAGCSRRQAVLSEGVEVTEPSHATGDQCG